MSSYALSSAYDERDTKLDRPEGGGKGDTNACSVED